MISEPREQGIDSASIISQRQPRTDQKGVTYTSLEGNAFVLEFSKTGMQVSHWSCTPPVWQAVLLLIRWRTFTWQCWTGVPLPIL